MFIVTLIIFVLGSLAAQGNPDLGIIPLMAFIALPFAWMADHHSTGRGPFNGDDHRDRD